MSPTFSAGVPKWSANILNFSCASWRLCSVRSIQGSLLLPPGLRVSYRSSDGTSFWGLLTVPKFPIFLGFFRSSRKDCSTAASNVLGSLHLFFCMPRLMTENMTMGCLTYLRCNFCFGRFSSCSVRRR